MAVPFLRPSSFAGGEITPSLFGHIDLAKFAIGASTMRNFFASYRGGAFSRGGTMFVGFSKQTGRNYPPRMVTFQFSINQGLALEFGDEYMRVISNGAYVTETARNIAAITQASPGVIRTSINHGYSTGNWVFISGVGGMTPLNGQIYPIVVVDADEFSLTDVYGNPINTTNYPAFTSGGTVARVFTLSTPWAEEDLQWMKWVQSKDVMSICCWNQESGTSYQPYDLARQANNAWTVTAFEPAPTVDPPVSCSGAASAAGTTDFQYVVTTINLQDGTESVASPIGDVPNSIDIGSALGSITITWQPPTSGGSKFNIYKATPAYNSTVPPGAVFGYAGTAFGTQFIDPNITPDFTQVPPSYVDPFAPGAIENVDITSGGSGLTTVTWAVTTGTGSGFDGYPVVVGGSMTAFVITNHGRDYAPGDSIAFNGAGYAAGAIDFTSTNPANNDTITLNSVVWTFKTTVGAANQTEIKATLALTLDQLVADLNASPEADLIVATYSQSTDNLVVRYKTAGTAGNAYTLAASAATPSGATLTGGSGTSGSNPTADLDVGPEDGTYPSVPTYFQQRRVYASSPNEPDTYWMSQPGSFGNFDTRSPTIDSDAITGNPWSLQVNGIQAMVSMPGGLVVLTGNGAWQLVGSGGSSLNPQAITPSNQQAQPQAYNGCHSHVPPIAINFDILYVQAKGSIVRDLNYNFFVNIYTGTDITVLSSHLFEGYQIREWAWSEEPYKLLWAVRSDGILVCLTYLKEQEVNAWSRSDTNGLFVSVCSVTEPPVDAVYFAVQRFPAGETAYMIERMDDRLWSDIEEVWAVDSGLSYPMPTPNATLTASSAAGLGALAGIDNLVGGGNYSAQTYVEITDNNGTGEGAGAVGQITIVGGVVTGIVFSPAGTGYTYPKLTIKDPTGQGSGASADAVLDTSVSFTASSGVFVVGDVGNVIRMGGGCALITQYLSATQVNAHMRSPIVEVVPNSGGVPRQALSGDWTLTEPTQRVNGLNHLLGVTVTGLADGQIIPPQLVVDDGEGNIGIDLPEEATAIVVGQSFCAQLQSVYLDIGAPTVQGQRKKIAAVTVRVENARDYTVGQNQPDGSTQSPPRVETRWSQMTAAPNVGEAPYMGKAPYPYVVQPALTAPSPLYSMDARVPLKGGFQKQGQIAVEQANPVCVNVLAFIPEVLGGDNPEAKIDDNRRRRAA